MKPKLLVFTSTFPRWRNDTDPPFVFELSKRLLDKFEVLVLAPHYPGAAENETIVGVRVFRFRYFFSKFEKLAGGVGIIPTLRKKKMYYFVVPFFFFGGLWGLVRLVWTQKPQIIHAHWLIPQGLVCYIVKKITGSKYIITAHGADVFAFQSSLLKPVLRKVLESATYVTAVSKKLKTELVSTYPCLENKITVAPMGVDYSVFSSGSRNSQTNADGNSHINPTILFVGRLSEKKGVRYLLEAFALLQEELPEARLTVVGSGEEEWNLLNLAKSLNVSKKINFIGAVHNSELPVIYSKNDIFVAPSILARGGDTEGFGLTLVEASMAGCLVIASDVGGISDIITDGKTGFLVEQKNARAIKEKIIEAISDSTRAKQIADNGKKFSRENFDWICVRNKYAEVILAYL